MNLKQRFLCLSAYEKNKSLYDAEKMQAANMVLSTVEDAESRNVYIVHDIDLDGNTSYSLIFSLLYAAQIFSSSRSIRHAVDHIPVSPGRNFVKSVKDSLLEKDIDYTTSSVFILDHSFNAALYKDLCDRFQQVIWIDHHQVNLTEEENDIDYRASDLIYISDLFSTTGHCFDICSSAAEHFVPKLKTVVNFSALKRFVKLVNHHDTWQFNKGSQLDDEEARSLATWFDLTPGSKGKLHEFIYDCFTDLELTEELHLTRLFNVISRGSEFIRTREMVVKKMLPESMGKVKWTIKDREYYVGYVMHSDNRSNLGHEILTAYPELDVAVVFFYSSSAKSILASVRGRQGTSYANDISKYFKGGGHLSASGFSVSPELFSKLLTDFDFND